MPGEIPMNENSDGRIIRLEVENFKSYNGRHTIGPFDHFTCVIGPNGAGKSNLMDSVCFVLGLKAGQLRGKKLKDLIYTDGKKKGVTHKHAWVKLVYGEANGDGSETEHVFMRTIHQTGASEYHMNGTPMSWEEYNKQLFQRNINVKAKNFLVFQGDVATMAEREPSEVTALIETISGSEALKNEYLELERLKKEASEKSIRNFQKRKNMANEKRHVKEQKEEAERYHQLENELAKYLLQFALFKLHRIEKDIGECIEEQTENEEKLEEAARMESAAEENVKDKKKEQAKLSKEVAAVEKQVEAVRSDLEKRQPDFIRSTEEKKRALKSINDLKKQEKEEKKKASKEEEDLKVLKADHAEVCLQIEDLEKAIQASNKKKNVQLMDQQVTEYNQLKDEARKKTIKITSSQLQPCQRKLKEQTDKLESLGLKLREAEIRKEKAENLAKDMQKRMEVLEGKVDEAKEQLSVDKKKLEESQKQNRSLKKKQEELVAKIDAYNTKVSNAKADQRNSDREAKLTQALRKLKGDYPTVKGRFHELVSPVSQKYNTAVTVACGKSMDAVIVQDEKTAMDCIRYMKEAKIGTFTFIPLDTIRVKDFDENARSLGGSKLLVADVLKYEPYLERAVRYAVGNTVVCDEIKEAKKLAFESRSKTRYRVVTLDGMLIEKNGLMTGGVGESHKKAAKWDEKELDQVKKARDQAHEELLVVQSKRRSEREDEKLSAAINRRVEEQRFWNNDIKISKERLSKSRADITKSNKEIDSLKPEIGELEAAIAMLRDKEEDLKKQIHSVEDKTFASFSKKVGVASIRDYEESILRERKEHHDRKTKLTAQRTKLQDKISFLEEKSRGKGKDIESQIAKKEAEVQKLTNNIAAMEADKIEKDNKMDELKEKARSKQRAREDLEVELAELKKRSADAKKQSQAIQSEQDTIESKIEKLRSNRITIYEECKVSEIAIPVISEGASKPATSEKRGKKRTRGSASEEQSQTLSEAFDDSAAEGSKIQIDFTAFEEEFDTSADVERVMANFQTKISHTKSQLETLAPNMKAVEQYRTLEDQLQETAGEFDDARRACKEAESAFNNCAQKRHDLFMNAFSHIQGRIGDIYKQLTRNTSELTSSGTAELILENPDTPYLHGVKFQVMPPKKKYREMKDLSGGEKTLAALALLFAIQEYNPSPFIVLDEVDAALDNENVGRVSRYIQEKAENGDAQCIVISLKDQFFERADALVGICRDHSKKSSSTLTIDLKQYA